MLAAPKLYALIGYPVTHSFSPRFFNDKFRAEGISAIYEAHAMPDIHTFPGWLSAHPQLAGINVTIPHKQSVMRHLDHIDAAAAAIGAVNCISIRNGVTTGHNTDVIGFRDSLLPLLPDGPVSALVLGSGGAASAATWVLSQLHVPFTTVSRSLRAESLTYQQLTPEIIRAHLLIVNCTPLGMYPAVLSSPALPYEALTPRHILFDMVYNPEQTLFLQQGAAAGATIRNGQEMLRLQALAAWELWNMP